MNNWARAMFQTSKNGYNSYLKKLDKSNLTAKESTSDIKETSSESSDCSGSVPVLSINMNKGGPRSLLYALCKKKQWPLPSFDSTEYEDRSQFQSCEGLEGSKGTNCFVSKVSWCIPDDGNIECKGEARADKKSSFDSAAVQALYELQRLRKVQIVDVSQ